MRQARPRAASAVIPKTAACFPETINHRAYRQRECRIVMEPPLKHINLMERGRQAVLWSEAFPSEREPYFEDMAAFVGSPFQGGLCDGLEETDGLIRKMGHGACPTRKGLNAKYRKAGRARSARCTPGRFFFAPVAGGREGTGRSLAGPARPLRGCSGASLRDAPIRLRALAEDTNSGWGNDGEREKPDGHPHESRMIVPLCPEFPRNVVLGCGKME